METERRQAEPVRELRLEGTLLFVIGGVLVACMAGAFFLGRWYERQSLPHGELAGSANPLGQVVGRGQQAPADVEASANYFDTLEGSGKELEPSRELAQADPDSVGEVATPRVRPRNSPAPGDYFVQVFAGRNEASAAELIEKLEGSGYRVDLQSQREVAGTLFKVRVGGFETMDLARDKAQELKKRGYSGAWVPAK